MLKFGQHLCRNAALTRGLHCLARQNTVLRTVPRTQNVPLLAQTGRTMATKSPPATGTEKLMWGVVGSGAVVLVAILVNSTRELNNTQMPIHYVLPKPAAKTTSVEKVVQADEK